MTDLSHDPDFFALLTGSYARRLGESLVPAGADAAWLYAAAPFAVLAHDGARIPASSTATGPPRPASATPGTN